MGDWCIFVTPTIVNFRAILVQQTDEVSITLLKKVKNFTSSIDRGFLMGDPICTDFNNSNNKLKNEVSH